MLKQSLIYLALSIAVILFAKYIHLIIVYIGIFYSIVMLKLMPIFNQSHLGLLICKVMTLIVLPMGITAIPALIYRGIKGHNMPYFIQITWFLWLIIVLSKILIH